MISSCGDAVICPYCRARCAGDQLLMSCGPLCASAPPFPVKALRRNRCPHGRVPLARRVCPACGRAVPREYAEAPGRAIVVVGEREAGKSAWISAAVRQFETGEAALAGLSVHLLGESSRNRYADLRTPSAEPLLMSIRSVSAKPVVLALYELPEDDCPPDVMATAAGVVHVIDPGRLPGVRTLFGLEPLPPRPTPWAHPVPTAMTVTKLDLVRDMFTDGSPLRRPGLQDRGHVESDSLDVHHEVEAWLARWGGIEAPPGHRCFALSALDGQRVAEPLLWLLSQFRATRA
ncbi:hypothetical protein [Lentzea sp. NPDC092896]|uniref:hypothetical protein n=1 Tax=Lentzea sp. NPDC092896 TaxID=3364127 RepID=UPI00382B2BC6